LSRYNTSSTSGGGKPTVQKKKTRNISLESESKKPALCLRGREDGRGEERGAFGRLAIGEEIPPSELWEGGGRNLSKTRKRGRERMFPRGGRRTHRKKGGGGKKREGVFVTEKGGYHAP